MDVWDYRTDGLVDLWFYVRYADPHPHLRLRLRGVATTLWGTVLPALSETLASLPESHCIRGFHLDTYEPETTRYGGDHGMALAEALFDADSDAALALLNDESIATDQRFRELVACVAVDRLLDDFGIKMVERQSVLVELLRQYGRRVSRQDINAHFRSSARELAGLLGQPSIAPASRWRDALNRRSAANRELLGQSTDVSLANRLEVPLARFIGAVIHMNLNRLLLRPATEEMLVYGLLERHYYTQRARRRDDQRSQRPSR